MRFLKTFFCDQIIIVKAKRRAMRVRVCLLLALLATQVCAESADVAEMEELAPKEGDDPPPDPQTLEVVLRQGSYCQRIAKGPRVHRRPGCASERALRQCSSPPRSSPVGCCPDWEADMSLRGRYLVPAQTAGSMMCCSSPLATGRLARCGAVHAGVYGLVGYGGVQAAAGTC